MYRDGSVNLISHCARGELEMIQLQEKRDLFPTSQNPLYMYMCVCV